MTAGRRETGCNPKFKIPNKFQIQNEFFFSIFCARSAHESTKARKHEGTKAREARSEGSISDPAVIECEDMVVDDREHLIQEEKRRIRRLRVLVDLTTSVLYQDAALTLEEAQQLVRGAEKAILKMFPDKQQTFDLVLRPRFERILRERWGG